MAEPLEAYWMALGKFVHRYALIEATLFQFFAFQLVCQKIRPRQFFQGYE